MGPANLVLYHIREALKEKGPGRGAPGLMAAGWARGRIRIPAAVPW
jgi:hypothetical protein